MKTKTLLLPASLAACTAVQAAGPLPPPAHASRPAYNTGSGFFVAGGKLFDPTGVEFRPRGVNRLHWDQSAGGPGIALAGANAERLNMDYTRPQNSNWTYVSTQVLAYGIVPIPSNWAATCKADTASLDAIVDTWVAQAATWTQLNGDGLVNIANEWGPASSTVWRDGYIAAVQRMRQAGYTGTLVVDSGGCGQDTNDLVNYGAAVLAGDPQHNLLFSLHVYGSFHDPATASWQQDFHASLAALAKTGLPVVVGEFGPGHNVGPSPTTITPIQVIGIAETYGWGWLAWGWDDNDLAACASDDNWFSMTRKCAAYATAADLTLYGGLVVPLLQWSAQKANLPKGG